MLQISSTLMTSQGTSHVFSLVFLFFIKIIIIIIFSIRVNSLYTFFSMLKSIDTRMAATTKIKWIKCAIWVKFILISWKVWPFLKKTCLFFLFDSVNFWIISIVTFDVLWEKWIIYQVLHWTECLCGKVCFVKFNLFKRMNGKAKKNMLNLSKMQILI